MNELRGEARVAAKPLVEALPSSYYALSVVDDRSDGRVFVDDVAHPTVALVWETRGNLFISSELTAKGLPAAPVLRQMRDLIVGEYIPAAIRANRPMCCVTYAPQSWGTQLSSVLPDARPIADRRLLYRALEPDEAATARLSKLSAPPEGCEVRPVDRTVLESGMGNVGDVIAEVTKMWGSVDRFLREGFGYCVAAGDTITAWCTSECPTGSRIGVGVETVEDYQRRGHGTAAAACTLLRCRREGLVADWDCYETNVPSIELAEKLGLSRVTEYPIRFFWFNRLDNMLVNGNVALKRERPGDAAEWFDIAYEEASSGRDVQGSWHFATPERRAWWCSKAADAYEQAGMPGMAKEFRERAARESDSRG